MSEKMLQDHLQRTVTIHDPPTRIISLCPSITETLYALQLLDRIVGRTRYCIHPAEEVSRAAVVGGTKQINMDAVDLLKPDLIIAEKEENPKEMIEQLASRYPVYVTNVENFEDALKMIADLGILCARGAEAEIMVKHISESFQIIPSADKPIKVAYVIWNNPYMAAGRTTFINSNLELCGFHNVFKQRPERYPVITVEDLRNSEPDLILLSSEPYPFQEKHRDELARQQLEARTVLVDGEYFSWYGVRMIDAASYFQQLILSLKG